VNRGIHVVDAGARGVLLGHPECLRHELESPMAYVTHAIDEVARLADRVVWR
jgi:ABC-type molybdate transport system ATPase subunit